jgi:hypothetical protein
MGPYVYAVVLRFGERRAEGGGRSREAAPRALASVISGVTIQPRGLQKSSPLNTLRVILQRKYGHLPA